MLLLACSQPIASSMGDMEPGGRSAERASREGPLSSMRGRANFCPGGNPSCGRACHAPVW